MNDNCKPSAPCGTCETCRTETSPEPGTAVRTLRLTRASDIEPEPVIWAWEDGPDRGRIPAGALTIAAGREGTGKSSFGIWLAAMLSRGELPGTFHGTPRAVFYCAVEDSWTRTLAPRLIAAGADMDRVYRVEVDDVRYGEVMVSLPVDVDLIEAAIAEHGAAALIVDPIMSTLAVGTDGHRAQDVRRALEPLVRMAERTTALTLGIMHFSKAAGTDASQLISGSGAFKDLARAILAFARDRETDEQVMTQVKNSLGRLDLPSLSYRIDSVDLATPKGKANVGRLTFTGETDRSVEDTLAPQGEGEERSERDEAHAWLVDYIAEHGPEVDAGDALKAAEKIGIAKRTLQRARARAGVRSRKSDFGRGWVWAAATPEGATAAPQGAEGAKPQELAPSAPSVSPSLEPEPTAHMWWPGRRTGEHGRHCAGCRRAPGGPDAPKDRST